MNIFNSNDRLRELAMYALDWGVFLRHDMDSTVAPFLILQNGGETYMRVLMTDGDPVDYAKRVLPKEEKSFEQFAIGVEGYIRDKDNNRVDAIIVQAYDVTQEKGVILSQSFNPVEKGGFRKIDKIAFLGHTDLIIDRKDNPAAVYSVEPAAVNGIAVKDDGDTCKYVAVFVHGNPSVVANEIKHYMRGSFTGEKRATISGQFELNVLEEYIKDPEFLTFLVTNVINEELDAANVKSWLQETGRTINVIVKHGENVIYSSSKISAPSPAATNTESKSEYESLSPAELHAEFHRIVAIPNARTNITALTQMTALMDEYKRRGLELPAKDSTGYEYFTPEQMDAEFNRIVSIPNARSNETAVTQLAGLITEYEKRGLKHPSTGSTPATDKKWWQFWK